MRSFCRKRQSAPEYVVSCVVKIGDDMRENPGEDRQLTPNEKYVYVVIGFLSLVVGVLRYHNFLVLCATTLMSIFALEYTMVHAKAKRAKLVGWIIGIFLPYSVMFIEVVLFPNLTDAIVQSFGYFSCWILVRLVIERANSKMD
jgi:nitrate reductase NapE component